MFIVTLNYFNCLQIGMFSLPPIWYLGWREGIQKRLAIGGMYQGTVVSQEGNELIQLATSERALWIRTPEVATTTNQRPYNILITDPNQG